MLISVGDLAKICRLIMKAKRCEIPFKKINLFFYRVFWYQKLTQFW